MALADFDFPRLSFAAWRMQMSLRARFAIAGGALMLTAMVLGGIYITHTATQKSIESRAASTGLLVSRLLDPYVDALSVARALSYDERGSLDALLGSQHLSARFPHLDIWDQDGRIIYSRSDNIMGLSFVSSAALTSAFAGDFSARLTDLSAGEHRLRGFEKQFLEIYIPLRDAVSGEIVAVAEIHEITDDLDAKIAFIQRQVWIVLALSTLLLMGSLYGIVAQGTRTIALQHERLQRQLCELRIAHQEIEQLNRRVQRASRQFARNNERMLRQVGADLHDGPAQLIALAAMKVGRITEFDLNDQRAEASLMKSLLDEALSDIRAISRGLMLPEIQEMQVEAVVRRAVSLHELRTGTSVQYEFSGDNGILPAAVNVCVFRFVQEGLANAFWHADGHDQTVVCHVGEFEVALSVSDGGGLGRTPPRQEGGLGLGAMRDRVESLGGTLDIGRMPDGGARVSIVLPINGGGEE